ncbi:hypothetical protein MKK68_16585 [Methylobacterium sp. E-016]|uniref:hypothetical protein n=1 Tax=Methylobacterium sp. E-016 TaxID=2836556 RepID=UPI001FBB7AE7|nr:hypothetical protein [Methylobacterium sp. E-016]MCJ2077244.1 hypothetical protein [Methylobacterium sp. E-016]
MRKAAATAVFLMAALTPTLALARRVIVEDRTAGRDLQGAAAFLALFPVVAVAVFAMARWVGWRE